MYRTKLFAFVLFLLVASPLLAQPRITGDTKVTLPKLVRLTAENADPKAGMIWRISPAQNTDRATTPKGRLEFSAKPGTYTVELMTIKLSTTGETEVEVAEVTVVVSDGGPAPNPVPPNPNPVPPNPNPNPNPTPPNPPNPVPPDDVLVKPIQAAYDNDKSTNKKESLQKLQKLYEMADAVVDDTNIKTMPRLLKGMRDAADKLLGITDLLPVRRVIGDELNRILGEDVGDLTVDKRSAAKTLFKRISNVLKGIKP